MVEQPVEAATTAAGAVLAALRAAAQLLQAAGADPAVLRAAAQLLHAAGAAPEDAAADPAAAAAHRAAIAAGKQPVVDAASDTAWTGLGMPPADAPLSAAALRGSQADAALAWPSSPPSRRLRRPRSGSAWLLSPGSAPQPTPPLSG